MCLRFTDRSPPEFKDRFWEIRQMVEEWNSNMKLNFRPGWVTCLDESMMIWTNKWTCPGWMFVLRKPNPFGNKWHTICCGLSSILFSVLLVEGKDKPRQMPGGEV
mmetsp:Transcript_27068/g.62251  ORF Transcript_27068/g.62251 Transcript_27068/m.62251 type:complete len:105 (+) Transcript_27068:506-820(+)